MNIFLLFVFFFNISSCRDTSVSESISPIYPKDSIVPGSSRMDQYLHLLKGRRVALVVNHSSLVAQRHLVDTLLDLHVDIKLIFAPEHGFRGTADAGAYLDDSRDKQTGLPIISLYGKNKKPKKTQLDSIDVVLFDIQDVGARFYTYLSTLHLVMEAVAENQKQIIVLDRPNPNGFYVDGPVLDSSLRSFVGMHTIPIVHGMTLGELAKMINGQGWLGRGVQADLYVVACLNYNHTMSYDLPVKPSPNLPNQRAVLLYPSLCLFEGTVVSVGRGTNKQFQLLGHPKFSGGNFEFVPKPMPGAKHPKLQGKLCKGYSFAELDLDHLLQTKKINLSYLLEFYNNLKMGEAFFLKNNFFDKLAGTKQLKKQIINGATEDEIRKSWQKDLNAFKSIRKKYLIYSE